MVTGPEDSPIFVVGMQRSGTTLMRSILSSNPRMTISPETAFFLHGMKNSNGNDYPDKATFYRFWEAYLSAKWFHRLGIPQQAVLGTLKAKGKCGYKELFQSMMEVYAEKVGKPRWGEKTPGHEKWLGRIFEWFPNARVIFLIRDPRGVSASLKKVFWGGRNVYVNTVQWKKSIQAYRRWGNDERVMVVQFEQLLDKPEREIQRICKFLGEEFSVSMLERSDGSKYVDTNPGWTRDYEKQVLRPIDTKPLYKWQNSLVPSEIALIEYMAARELVSLGYELVNSESSLSQSARYIAASLGYSLRKLLKRILPEGVLALLNKSS